MLRLFFVSKCLQKYTDVFCTCLKCHDKKDLFGFPMICSACAILTFTLI